uniref:Ion_trans domain-containing protein n=1 Tax=Rhabditophanes sp. KR3021 TaxID=114890 RepID=A0AC35TWA9_9BILA
MPVETFCTTVSKISRSYRTGAYKRHSQYYDFLTNKTVIKTFFSTLFVLFVIHVSLMTVSDRVPKSVKGRTTVGCGMAGVVDYLFFTEIKDYMECEPTFFQKFRSTFLHELKRGAKLLIKLPLKIISLSINTFALFGEIFAYALSELGDNMGKNMKHLRDFARSIS